MVFANSTPRTISMLSLLIKGKNESDTNISLTAKKISVDVMPNQKISSTQIDNELLYRYTRKMLINAKKVLTTNVTISGHDINNMNGSEKRLFCHELIKTVYESAFFNSNLENVCGMEDIEMDTLVLMAAESDGTPMVRNYQPIEFFLVRYN